MNRTAPVLGAAMLVVACTADQITVPLSAPSSVAAARSVSGAPFESFGCDQGLTDGKVWITGDGLHIRGQSSLGMHLSTDPNVSGSIRVYDVNADINLVTGTGDFSGQLELTPTALGGSGAWHTHFKGSIPGVPGGPLVGDPPTLILSHMLAHGTGALAGGTLEFDHTANLAFEHPDFPDGCEWTGELFKGVVTVGR